MDSVMSSPHLPPIRDRNFKNSSEAASDKAFKARLRREELEGELRIRHDAEQRHRDTHEEETLGLLKQIRIQREKERKAYLKELQAMENELRFNASGRTRQQEIARRLEDIQISEARQKDEDGTRRNRLLRQLLIEKGEVTPWNYWNHGDYLGWFRFWQICLQDLYIHSPLGQLTEIGERLDEELIKLREVLRRRYQAED